MSRIIHLLLSSCLFITCATLQTKVSAMLNSKPEYNKQNVSEQESDRGHDASYYPNNINDYWRDIKKQPFNIAYDKTKLKECLGFKASTPYNVGTCLYDLCLSYADSDDEATILQNVNNLFAYLPKYRNNNKDRGYNKDEGRVIGIKVKEMAKLREEYIWQSFDNNKKFSKVPTRVITHATQTQRSYVRTLYKNEKFQLAFKTAWEIAPQKPALLKQFVTWNERIYDTVYGIPLFLHKYCKEKNVEIVKNLILAGANVNKEDWRGRVPLHFTALGKNNRGKDITTMLLDAGANPHVKDLWERLPLQLSNNLGSIQLLLSNLNGYRIVPGSEEFKNAIFATCRARNHKKLEILLRLKPDLKKKQFKGLFTQACKAGSPKVVDMLLQYNPSLVSMNKSENPLHCAPNREVVNLILSHDKNKESLISKDGSPLHQACSLGHTSAAKELTKYIYDYASLVDAPKWQPREKPLRRRQQNELIKCNALYLTLATHPKLKATKHVGPKRKGLFMKLLALDSNSKKFNLYSSYTSSAYHKKREDSPYRVLLHQSLSNPQNMHCTDLMLYLLQCYRDGKDNAILDLLQQDGSKQGQAILLGTARWLKAYNSLTPFATAEAVIKAASAQNVVLDPKIVATILRFTNANILGSAEDSIKELSKDDGEIVTFLYQSVNWNADILAEHLFKTDLLC